MIARLVRAARARGDDLTGPDGLLKLFTKTTLEIALDEEMSDHLGYDKHAIEGRGTGNSRNGIRAKTVLTDNVGPVTIDVPRDRDGTFDPVIVKKRQRRMGGVDTIALSLYARGLTTGEISAHFAEIYGASLSKDRISLKGLPDSATAVFPLATVQTCIIHLIRGSFRYASKKYWEKMAKDLRLIYTAPSRDAAWAAFEQFEETWSAMYPAISRLWRDAWEQFVPFLVSATLENDAVSTVENEATGLSCF